MMGEGFGMGFGGGFMWVFWILLIAVIVWAVKPECRGTRDA